MIEEHVFQTCQPSVIVPHATEDPVSNNGRQRLKRRVVAIRSSFQVSTSWGKRSYTDSFDGRLTCRCCNCWLESQEENTFKKDQKWWHAR